MRQADDENILVIVNFDGEDALIDLNIPQHAIDYFGIEKKTYTIVDLFSGTSIEAEVLGEHAIKVEIPAYGARIFKMKL